MVRISIYALDFSPTQADFQIPNSLYRSVKPRASKGRAWLEKLARAPAGAGVAGCASAAIRSTPLYAYGSPRAPPGVPSRSRRYVDYDKPLNLPHATAQCTNNNTQFDCVLILGLYFNKLLAR